MAQCMTMHIPLKVNCAGMLSGAAVNACLYAPLVCRQCLLLRKARWAPLGQPLGRCSCRDTHTIDVESTWSQATTQVQAHAYTALGQQGLDRLRAVWLLMCAQLLG
jgi:hypothetical protein